MVLLNILTPLLFLVLSLGELLRFQVGNGVSVGPIDAIVALMTLVWIARVNKNNYSLKKAIVAFGIVGLISLVINFKNFSHQQIIISSLYLFRFLFYTFVYFIFADLGKKFGGKITRYMAISGMLILVIGFLQFILYPSLRGLYYLGWDEHLYRLFSSYLDPNFTGVILVLFFVFIFIMKEKLFVRKITSALILILTFVGIILTYSRGALLMFLVCALTYSVIQKNYKIVFGAIGIMALVFVILSPRFYLENTNLLRMVSTKERIETSRNALGIFQKNPLGVGFDTYRYAREKYGDKDKSLAGLSHSGAGVDSSLIFVLVTTGIEGLLVYAYLLWKIFKLGFDNIKKDKIGIVLVVSLTGLIVNSLFINSLFYSFIMIWLWILAGLTESSLRE